MRRRERGGAYLYVIVCVSVMGILLVALVPYATQARTVQTRREQRARADMTADALVQQVIAEASVASPSVGSVRTLTLNGATASVTVTDGAAVVANSLLLTGTTTTADGQAFKIARYVAVGAGPNPYKFALYSASDLTYAGNILSGAGGTDGDVFVNGNAAVNGSGIQVNGDFSAKKSISLAGGAIVTGARLPNAKPVAFPAANGTDYYNAAAYRFGAVATITGIGLVGTTVPYTLAHINGDFAASGPITNRGCVYVAGNMTVTGNLTYGNAASEVAFVIQGNLTFQSGVSLASGYYYVQGQVINQSPSLTINRGGLIANTVASAAGTLAITRDNFVKDGPTEGFNLYLPGYWP